ncbi:MAG: NADH:flavin oxidoreductase [Elusimicrobia bacterium]|nr:NADH:flavin oxidoreductase [Elusimicrobiota bacterium]
MNQEILNRFSPYRFTGGKTAKNRVVVPPMCSQTADARGNATPATIEHYAKLAQSGAGIVFVEYSFVHSSGKGEDAQLAADSDANIDGLSEIAAAIRRSGALAGLQLVHVGGKTLKALTGREPMSPSGVRVPVKGWEPDGSVEMTLADIGLWIRWFTNAALRARAAGFDIVELHAAHGYGLNQWLSPLTNMRTDGYGGSMAGRGRMLFEIIESIKAAAPESLLAVRLPGQDHMEGGLTTADMGWLVRRLESLGLDLIDVSSGIGGWRRPEGRLGEGYLVNDAAALKAFTTLPVVGVGGIESGGFIDQIIAEGRVDFAAVGRAILRDPYAWGQDHLSGVKVTAIMEGAYV